MQQDEDGTDSMCEGDPTPEQIDEEAAKIRKGWSKRTRQNRRVTKWVRFGLVPVSTREWAESVLSAFGH